MIAIGLFGLACLFIVWGYWYVAAREGARRGWSRRKSHGLGVGLGVLTVLCLAVSVMQVRSANRLALEAQAEAAVSLPALAAER